MKRMLTIVCMMISVMIMAEDTQIKITSALLLNLADREPTRESVVETFVELQSPTVANMTKEELVELKVWKWANSINEKDLERHITDRLIIHANRAKRERNKDAIGLYLGMARYVIGYARDVLDEIEEAENNGISVDYKAIMRKMKLARAEKVSGKKNLDHTERIELNHSLSGTNKDWRSPVFYPKVMRASFTASSPYFVIRYSGATIKVWEHEHVRKWGKKVKLYLVVTRGNKLTLDLGRNGTGVHRKIEKTINGKPSRLFFGRYWNSKRRVIMSCSLEGRVNGTTKLAEQDD